MGNYCIGLGCIDIVLGIKFLVVNKLVDVYIDFVFY